MIGAFRKVGIEPLFLYASPRSPIGVGKIILAVFFLSKIAHSVFLFRKKNAVPLKSSVEVFGLPFPKELQKIILEYAACQGCASLAHPKVRENYYSDLSKEFRKWNLGKYLSDALHNKTFCLETAARVNEAVSTMSHLPKEIKPDGSLAIVPLLEQIRDFNTFFRAVSKEFTESLRPIILGVDLIERAAEGFLFMEINWNIMPFIGHIGYEREIEISKISSEIKKLVSLKSIYLDKNRPKNLQESTADLFYLKEITFSRDRDNPNEEFPQSIGKFELSQRLRRTVIYHKKQESE